MPTRDWSGLESYLDRFSHAPQDAVLGDASVWYLYSQDALQKIKEYNADAKILIMLRNPVKAAEALHGQLLLDGRETLHDFESAWRAIASRRQRGGTVNRQLQYDRVFSYAEQIERAFSVFPREQVRIIVLEEFLLDPKKSFAQTLEFFDVAGTVPEKFERVNESKRIKSRLLHNVLYTFPKSLGPAYRVVKKTTKRMGIYPGNYLRGLHRKYNIETGARRQIRPEFRAELMGAYKVDIEKVGLLLGHEPKVWRYDPSDVASKRL